MRSKFFQLGLLATGTSLLTACVMSASGTVSGLTGTGLVLRYHAYEEYCVGMCEQKELSNEYLNITANGPFAFKTAVYSPTYGHYVASVATQPSGQICVLDGPESTGIPAASLYHLDVQCTPRVETQLLAGDETAAGSVEGSGAEARLSYPKNMAVDSAGNLYLPAAMLIQKITPAGNATLLAGTPGNIGSADGLGTAASFYDVTGIAADSSGFVYVTDAGNHNIRKITPAGVVATFAGTAGNAGSADGSGAAAQFNAPRGIVVDNAGNLYVADSGNQTIRRIGPDGTVTTLAGMAGSAGKTDGSGSAARFNGPDGLAIDSAGNLYVADSGNALIRKITPSGVVTTVAGSGGHYTVNGTGAAASFRVPTGIAIDAGGNLYVAQSDGHIRKIDTTGEVTTIERSLQDPAVALAGDRLYISKGASVRWTPKP